MSKLARCAWVTDDALYLDYHDTEWGTPLRDEDRLFEFLLLESFQAGLSWLSVLKKRENFRAAFDNFDAEKIARYDEAKIADLLADAGIIRNRLKVNAAVTNAKAVLTLREEGAGLSGFLWAYVDGAPLQPHRRESGEVPALTELSNTISKDLKKRGFKFVGSTIIYALMQATGMVNDHTRDCFRYKDLRS